MYLMITYKFMWYIYLMFPYICVCTHTHTHTHAHLLKADLGSHMDHFPWTCVQNKAAEAMMAPIESLCNGHMGDCATPQHGIWP